MQYSWWLLLLWSLLPFTSMWAASYVIGIIEPIDGSWWAKPMLMTMALVPIALIAKALSKMQNAPCKDDQIE